MPNILDIKRRIRSVVNTRQITKAMKMVSAAKLRRAQERALAARPYAQMLTNVLKSLVARADVYDEATGEVLNPLLIERDEQNILFIVVTGDKGLAGAFNTNICKAAMKFLGVRSGKSVEIEAVGRKGRDFLRRRFPSAEPFTGEGSAARLPVSVVGEQVGVLGKLQFATAKEIADSVVERYTRGEIDSVYVVFNEFKSVVAQRLVVDRILPIREIGADEIAMSEELSAEARAEEGKAAMSAGVSLKSPDTSAMDEAAAHFATAPVDYIYEQTPAEIFQSLLPKYVGVQIFRALLESVAAEHAARMTAMESATSNASDMIDRLTLVMNRARQAKITREIIEIVSGAAAAG